MEVHIHVGVAGCPSMQPESLAAAWLAALPELRSKDLFVVATSNPLLAPQLPALVKSDKRQGPHVWGFLSLCKELWPEFRVNPHDAALLAFAEKFYVLVDWTLFANDLNYEKVTRPDLSSQIPFPLQYNAAIHFHRNAVENSRWLTRRKTSGRSTASDRLASEGVTKLHTQLLNEQKLREDSRELPKETMRIMTYGDELCRTVAAHLDGFTSHEGTSGGEWTPGKLLLAACLVLVSVPRLPSAPLAQVIDQYPALAALRGQARTLNYQVPLSPPSSETAYTLSNSFKHHLRLILPWSL